jgi:hypothetical protein
MDENSMSLCNVGVVALPKKGRKFKRSRSGASPKKPSPKKIASPVRKARPILPGNETESAILMANMKSAVLLSTEEIQSELATSNESAMNLLLESLPEKFQLRGSMETEWTNQFHAITSLRRVILFKHASIQGAPFVKQVLALAEDLRSGIIRNCLCCLSELFEFNSFPVEHVVDTVSLLLKRGCSTDKKFIKDLARKVLDTAVKHFDGQALLNALLTNSTHKNPAVVALCGVLSEQCLGKLAIGKKEGAGVGDLDVKALLLALPNFLSSTNAESKVAANKSCRRLRRAFGESGRFDQAVDSALSGLNAAQVKEEGNRPPKAKAKGPNMKLSLKERMALSQRNA